MGLNKDGADPYFFLTEACWTACSNYARVVAHLRVLHVAWVHQSGALCCSTSLCAVSVLHSALVSCLIPARPLSANMTAK